MKVIIAACTIALLSGCSTVETRVETVEVKVPVPVSCVNPDDIPSVVPGAGTTVTLESSPGEKIKAVLIERERLRQSDTELRAIVLGCLL